MRARMSAHRVNRRSTAGPSPRSSDGDKAAAIAPPGYGIDFVDRPAAATATLQRRAQPAPDRPGMPERLKAGLERLSGLDLSDVRVHLDSDRPARLDALAYAQGNDIHVAPGEERHLPHEAWHVVQQRQGRVRPTVQLMGAVPVNDDAGLEQEAEVMGARAARVGQLAVPLRPSDAGRVPAAAPGGRATVQRFYAVKDARNSARYPEARTGRVDRLPHLEWIDLPDPRDAAEYPDTVPGTGWWARSLYRRGPEPVPTGGGVPQEPHAVVESRQPEAPRTPVELPKFEALPLPPPVLEQTPALEAPSKPGQLPVPPALPTPQTVAEKPVPMRAPEAASKPVAPPARVSGAEPQTVATQPATVEIEPEIPKATQVRTLLDRYAQMQGRLDPVSRAQLRDATEVIEQDKEGLKANPRYADVWHENLIEHIPVWVSHAQRVGRSQVKRTELVGLREAEQTQVERLHVVVGANPDANQRTWATPEDLLLLEQARIALAPALAERRTRATSLGQTLAAQESIVGVPTSPQIREAVTAVEAHGRLAPVGVDETVLGDATRVARAVSPDGIKREIARLAREAHADPAKQLVLDAAQLRQLQDDNVHKTRAEVIQEIADRVEKQHVPGVAQWRKNLRLEQNRANLYIGPNAGRVDGYDTHISLFKDTIGNAANADVATTALPALQQAVLGSGVTGFHVTLEQGEPGSERNPHAYRGRPDALRKSFEERASKSPWDPDVKQGLEAIRNTEVARAEQVITDVQARLGAPPGKVAANV